MQAVQDLVVHFKVTHKHRFYLSIYISTHAHTAWLNAYTWEKGGGLNWESRDKTMTYMHTYVYNWCILADTNSCTTFDLVHESNAESIQPGAVLYTVATHNNVWGKPTLCHNGAVCSKINETQLTDAMQFLEETDTYVVEHLGGGGVVQRFKNVP